MRAGQGVVILVVRWVWVRVLFPYLLLRMGVLYTSSGLYHSFNAAIVILFNGFNAA
jgi:hypothetical protein